MKFNFSSYLEKLSAGLLGIFLFILPLAFTIKTTEAFALPKQLVLSITALAVVLLLSVKMVFDKTVTIRRTPFDLPIFLFLLAVFLSSIFAVNQAESLVAFSALFFSILVFFLITQSAKTRKTVSFLTICFLESGVVLAFFYLLTLGKIYLPFDFAKTQSFSLVGTLLDQAIYLSACLVFALFLFYTYWKEEKIHIGNSKAVGLLALGALKLTVILAGLVATLYGIYKFQRPIILPFNTGFQVGFAAISQDSSRAILSFLFGSGFGTFVTDFSRFKQAVFNQNQALWSLSFFRGSSFVLDLLATTGVLGVLAYLFLVFRIVKDKPLLIPALFLLILSFVLPFSSFVQALLFIVLGLFTAERGLNHKHHYDIELGLVASKSGIPVFTTDNRQVGRGLSGVLPFAVFLLILAFVGILGFYISRYAMANIIFQESIVAASQNKGSQAYTLQTQALNLFNYSDAYHRVFSQTNLALANSLSNSVPKGSSPSAQTSQTILTLIQQSISSGRKATSISTQTAVNWQNLSSIYRSLIGFGKNADSFAILTAQQAVLLDPTNPQEYLNLGGLYYQLQLWDKAEEQFRIAINLKPDFANAYYNLAHALQQKGDLKGALDVLDQVKALVKNDPTNLKKVQDEIDALKKGQTSPTQQGSIVPLPPRATPVPIPAPATPSPTPTPTPVPSPTTKP